MHAFTDDEDENEDCNDMIAEDQNEDSILEDMTISLNHTDMTPTPYQDANGSTTRLESQIELDEELHLSPVKFYYSHNDPGQYSIGHTPDLPEENYTPTQRAMSSSLIDEEDKLPIIQERIWDETNNIEEVEEEKEEKFREGFDGKNLNDTFQKEFLETTIHNVST